MARWKLMTAHYLNCPDTEWEYNEVNRSTGKPQRKRFPVPRYINPQDPADWTKSWGRDEGADGETIVCLVGKGERGDIEFNGDPTPDMVPIDNEAKAISATFADRWRYKPESAEISYSQALVDGLEEAVAEKMAKPVEIPGLQELAAAVGTIAAQNAELIKTITVRKL